MLPKVFSEKLIWLAIITGAAVLAAEYRMTKRGLTRS